MLPDFAHLEALSEIFGAEKEENQTSAEFGVPGVGSRDRISGSFGFVWF
jgi:hypothetical protein